MDGLFEPNIAVAYGDPRANWPLALPQEEASIRHAVVKRQGEFRAGRALAREAMAKLDLGPAPILSAEDRVPIWPDGMVGSISHCDDFCVAAVGRRADGLMAIGVDVEPAEALPEGVADEICLADEKIWLGKLDDRERPIFERLIFCAKESAYKCQYGVTGQLFGFDALCVHFDHARFQYEARFMRAIGPFRIGQTLFGRYVMTEKHLVTGMALGSDAFSRAGQSEIGRSGRDWPLA
nr:4'-phosphopantetheinyl transferase superfamily protein [Devosia faecipullorum]